MFIEETSEMVDDLLGELDGRNDKTKPDESWIDHNNFVNNHRLSQGQMSEQNDTIKPFGNNY